jgi:hypothetical protein
MLTLDQEIPLTLTVADCNNILLVLNDAPFKIAAPIIEKMRQQILAIDPTAFTPGAQAAKPNGAAEKPLQ